MPVSPFASITYPATSSGILRDWYAWLPAEVKGATLGVRKCMRGKGIRFSAIFLMSLKISLSVSQGIVAQMKGTHPLS